MTYLSNAFSIQMLDMRLRDFADVRFLRISPELAYMRLKAGFTSAIGHDNSAAVISDVLGMPIPKNRISVKLEFGDSLIVAQVTGGRLPEGSVTLPEGAEFQFFEVRLESRSDK